MRIAQSTRLFIAVLGLAAVLHQIDCQELFNYTLFNSRVKRSPRRHHEGWAESFYRHEYRLDKPGKLLSPRENQFLLKQEIKNRTAVDCCPSVLEMIEPEGGKNQEDQYVELYRDGNNRQRFYELSCHNDILDKPCRFMDKKLHNNSRCVQKYSYTYAIVKDPGRHHHQKERNFPSFPGGGATWTLDYIRIRSGCSCVVTPHVKQKRNKSRHKQYRHEGER